MQVTNSNTMTGVNTMNIARKVFAKNGVKFRDSLPYVMLAKLARGAGWPTHDAVLHLVKPIDIAINARAARCGRGPDGRAQVE
jgi:hypothetical protein